MKRATLKEKALTFFRRYVRVVLAAMTLLSLSLIIVGAMLPQDSVTWRLLLKMLLIQTGTTVLVASTIGIFLSEAYSELRELTIRDEIFQLVDRMKELVENPERIKTFRSLSHMERAGLLAFYPDRKGPAKDDLLAALTNLMEEQKEVTVQLIGDTLRVFFGSEGPFTYAVHEVLSRNPNVKFEVLLLHPNSRLSLYRAESESIDAPFKTDAQYQESGFFRDSKNSSSHIGEWNLNLTARRGNSTPIELRYYNCSDYCLAVIFPDVCYTAQYMYADAEAQVQTPGQPMLKFAAGSSMYEALAWNFDHIWNHHGLEPKEVARSLKEEPVVKLRAEGKL